MSYELIVSNSVVRVQLLQIPTYLHGMHASSISIRRPICLKPQREASTARNVYGCSAPTDVAARGLDWSADGIFGGLILSADEGRCA